jgi:hypothetical protein
VKAVFIDASPKRKDSTSGVLLNALESRLPAGVEVVRLGLHAGEVPAEVPEALAGAGALVFSCPLYVDALPSHLLSCLEQLEKAGERPGPVVYALVNCGFYEGVQADHALEVFRNWCAKAGLAWGGGLGIGGGGAIQGLPATGKGPMAPVCRALGELGERLSRRETGANAYLSIAFPRMLYRLAGQLGWRQQIRRNGGRAADLGQRPQ